ncbi:hypothetical protein [Methylobacterium oryzisoli]|uniref:hypothetical protein n=1 Tax=Methylobacterium oryzisoli TaxID=3385502 RepID=UPI00389241A6
MAMTSVNQAVIETLSRQIVSAYCAAAGEAKGAAEGSAQGSARDAAEGPAKGSAWARLLDEVMHAIEEPVGRRRLVEQGPERVNAALADWEAQEGRPFGLRLIEIDPARSTVTMG